MSNSSALLDVIEAKRDEDEDDFRHTYLGEPREDDDAVVIKRSWVMAALDACKKLGLDRGPARRLGFDVADSGADKNAHPNRKTRATGVVLGQATGAQWLAEFTATIKLLRDANFWAPVTIYVNSSDWFYATNTDYREAYAKTIAQRIREIEGIANIIPTPTIAANQIIGVG